MQSDNDQVVTTRLFVVESLKAQKTLRASASQAHYLRHVLRAQEGSPIAVFNGRDGEWLAKVEMTGRVDCSFLLKQRRCPQAEERGPWLLFAPIKKVRLDYLVQKAVELGVEQIQPVRTRRTIVRKINVARLNANAIEAAEQCGRLTVPKICTYTDIVDLVDGWQTGRTLVWGDETGCGEPALHTFRKCDRDVAFLIGPEGGFEDSERTLLRGKQFARAIDLGPRVLRSDTAVIMALALWQGVLNDRSPT